MFCLFGYAFLAQRVKKQIHVFFSIYFSTFCIVVYLKSNLFVFFYSGEQFVKVHFVIEIYKCIYRI